MKVLGIDGSLRGTGYGVVESAGSKNRALEFGVIRVADSKPHSHCLKEIDAELSAVIARQKPDAVAIEGIFFCRNIKTAFTLGEVRGVMIACAARAGVPVYEYAPRRMKQAIVGFGGAQKKQINKMICAMLGLAEAPPDDAADALGLAICHLQSRTSIAALSEKPL